jgi:hypothetical protein
MKWKPVPSEAVEAATVKFTISPGEETVIAVPLPRPGSASKKYSAFVIFWDCADEMNTIINSNVKSLCIPKRFNGEKWYSKRPNCSSSPLPEHLMSQLLV